MEKIAFNADEKFDLQLAAALVAERKLGAIFQYGKLEKIELKTESWLWERSGNICIEYKRDGKPSGIAVTQADYWVHELRRDGETLVYLMFPIDRLKHLTREIIRSGRGVRIGGDGNRQHIALLRLSDILK